MEKISIVYREADLADVPAMTLCRASDTAAGPADPRMSLYFEGRHHPQKALTPRTGFVAVAGDAVVGYIAGHATTRFDCEGELQYLYVAREYRRQGVATILVQHLAEWFDLEGIKSVCVNLDPESKAAVEFYRSCGAQPLNRHWYVWRDVSTILDHAP
jgi:GNAT superfamily N-acetyltransferase